MHLKSDAITKKHLIEQAKDTPRTKAMKQINRIKIKKDQEGDLKYNFIRMKNMRQRDRKRKADILKLKQQNKKEEE